MVAGGNVLRCVPGEPTLRYGIASDLVHRIALHLLPRVGLCIPVVSDHRGVRDPVDRGVRDPVDPGVVLV